MTERTRVSMICNINTHMQIRKRPARNAVLPLLGILLCLKRWWSILLGRIFPDIKPAPRLNRATVAISGKLIADYAFFASLESLPLRRVGWRVETLWRLRARSPLNSDVAAPDR